MIKNWRSLRWQALLNFSARHRLLITGTPLQNDLMELWSLMHFLMPHVFTSHAQFQGWFSNPLTGMVEGAAGVNAALVGRLHAVLRPFVLRRMKQARPAAALCVFVYLLGASHWRAPRQHIDMTRQDVAPKLS